MLKTVLAGTTALAIAGASLAYAAQPDNSDQDRAERWRPSAEDIAAFGDARIAALKAGLKLTPEQEKHWPAVEEALHGVAKQRADRYAAREADRSADFIKRLTDRAESMEAGGAALKKLADAATPLYGSLDDSQKRRFVMLARISGKRVGHWRGRHGWHDARRWHHRNDRWHDGPRGRDDGPGRDGPQPQ
jgi:zinc resistance-associated protein